MKYDVVILFEDGSFQLTGQTFNTETEAQAYIDAQPTIKNAEHVYLSKE